MATHDYDDTDSDNEKPKTGVDPAKDDRPGTDATQTKTDFEKRLVKTRLKYLGGGILILIIGYVIYQHHENAMKPVVATRQIKPRHVKIATQPPITTPPKPTTPKIEITPDRVDFGTLDLNDVQKNILITVMIKRGVYEFSNINTLYGEEQGIRIPIKADTCVNSTLKAGQSCSLLVTFKPETPLIADAIMTISGTAYNTKTGKSSPYSQNIKVTGQAKPAPAGSSPPPTTPGRTTPQKPANPNSITTIANPMFKQEQQARRISQQQQQFLQAQSINPAPLRFGDISASEENVDESSSGKNKRPVFERPYEKSWSTAVKGQIFESTYPANMSRVLLIGNPIPAVIKTTIQASSSQIATATVERDMYGADGRTVVVERGSLVTGSVTGAGSSSENRIQINWTRIVQPNGVVFQIKSNSGDAMGRAGVLGYTNERYMARFGAAIATSVIDAASIAAIGGNSTTTNTGGTTTGGSSIGGTSATTQNGQALASQAFQSNIEPLIKQIEKEQTTIPIIHVIPAGTAITIWPSEDLVLRPVETKRQYERKLATWKKNRTREESGLTNGRTQQTTQNGQARETTNPYIYNQNNSGPIRQPQANINNNQPAPPPGIGYQSAGVLQSQN